MPSASRGPSYSLGLVALLPSKILIVGKPPTSYFSARLRSTVASTVARVMAWPADVSPLSAVAACPHSRMRRGAAQCRHAARQAPPCRRLAGARFASSQAAAPSPTRAPGAYSGHTCEDHAPQAVSRGICGVATRHAATQSSRPLAQCGVSPLTTERKTPRRGMSGP
jgi:hypothetical protein